MELSEEEHGPELEAVLQDHLRKWQLTLNAAPMTTLSSYIVFVGSPAGPAVLKLFRPPYEEAASSRALLHFGDIAPRIFQFTDRALLMERIMPGTPLAELSLAGRDDEATEIICALATQLRALPLPQGQWRSIEEWGEGFARHRAGPGHPLLPLELINAGERVYFDLCSAQPRRILLHGDLHHQNILRDAAGNWRVIDPKGVMGESAFELGTALHNPIGFPDVFTSEDLLLRRVGMMSARLGYPEERLLRWLFAQSVLSLVWLAEDGFGAAEIRPLLQLINISRRLLA